VHGPIVASAAEKWSSRMLAHLLGLPDHPLVIFLSISIGGILLFLLISSLSYGYFFVLRRDHYHPEYDSDPPEVWRAIKWSLIAVFGNALLISPIHYLIATGHSKVYYAIDDYGWGWLLASILCLLVCTETLIYWIHRVLHGDLLYGPLHRIHHTFKVPTPYVGLSFNPLDSFLQGLPHHALAFILPFHVGLYLFSVAFVTVWAVMIHDRISFVSWWPINNTGHHTLHHWYGTYNFGQYFTFWDRLCGTHRSPFEGCEDVPEGVLRTAWEARDAAAVAPEVGRAA
jgi:lathosterol oxidase